MIGPSAKRDGVTPKVKFHEIPTSGLEFNFSQESGELDEALKDLLGDTPNYVAKLNLMPIEDMVHLKGHLSAQTKQACSRCSEDFPQQVKKNFVIAFYKSEDSIKNMGSGISGIGQLEGSFDLEFLEGNEIKLGEVVHEQVALEIPFQPLCSDTCVGLCTVCGTNLNTSSCQCAEKQISSKIKDGSSPFSTLKNLIGES